eukprot:Opistho-1_new@45795
MCVSLVADGLARVEHAEDAFLCLGMHDQRAEGLALQRHQVVLVHQRAGLHITTGHHVRDQAGDVEVVLADEAAVAHVDQAAQDGGLAVAAGHGEQALVRCAVAAVEQALGLVDGDVQQFVLVRHDHVGVQHVAELARLQRAGADLGHGRGGEAFGEEGQQVLARGGVGVLGRAAGDVGQAAGARHQAHANFHQADVAFHVHHAARAVHRQLAAAAQRQAAHGTDHRHVGITQAQHGLLHEALGVFDRAHAHRHEGRQHGLQVGARAEGFVARPDHQALVGFLGQVHGRHQAFADLGADGVHLGLDAGDQHLLVQCPDADPMYSALI